MKDPLQSRAHRNHFDLVRLILACLVLLSHAPEMIDGDRHRELLTRAFGTISLGELAIDGFFMLSGYLITASWLRTPDLRRFLAHRFFRIYPGFLVASLISATIVGRIGGGPDFWNHFPIKSYLISLGSLGKPEVGEVFTSLPYATTNGSLWTIRPEYVCYLMVAVLGLAGVLKRRICVPILALIAWTLFMIQQRFGLSAVMPEFRPVLLTMPLAHFFFFYLSGCSFYLFRDRIQFRWSCILLSAGLLFVAMSSPDWCDLALGTLGGYLLLAIGHCPIGLEGQSSRAWPDISYGVYLYGWPIQTLLIWYDRTINPWLLFGISLLASLVAGILSWYLVESPGQRLRARLTAAAPRVPQVDTNASPPGTPVLSTLEPEPGPKVC